MNKISLFLASALCLVSLHTRAEDLASLTGTALQDAGKYVNQLRERRPDLLGEVLGILVTGRLPGSQAEAADLRPGDIVIGYAGEPINDVETFLSLITKHASDGGNIELAFIRSEVKKTVLLKPGKIGMAIADVRDVPAVPKELLDGMPKVNSNPPDFASIAAYPTTDPELKDYLTLIASLGNNLEGVLGKEHEPAKREADLKKFEANMRKTMSSGAVSAGNRAETARIIEKAIEDEKKRKLNYLEVIPQGANPNASNARRFMMSGIGSDSLEMDNSSIGLVYEFGSQQELSDKAHALIEKLRPVFRRNSGWTFQDTAHFVKTYKFNIRTINGMSGVDPDRKQELKAQTETAMKTAELGTAMIQYQWKSKHKIQLGTTPMDATDQAMIMIMPLPPTGTEEGQKYTLSVMISKLVNTPKK